MTHFRFDPIQGVIVNPNGTPSMAFTVYWQKFREGLVAALTGLETATTDLAELVDTLILLNELIVAAEEAIDAVGGQNSIGDSYVSGLILDAFNDGADCHVDISNHTRHYADGTSVAVLGGVLSGIAHETVVRVYYDQADRSGGAVTYEWTSDADAAAQTGDRHSVGAVVTPRLAEVVSIRGSGATPPGYVMP